MGMDMKENNTSTSLEVLSVSPSDNFSISTSGYSSMMSIEDMTKQRKTKVKFLIKLLEIAYRKHFKYKTIGSLKKLND